MEKNHEQISKTEKVPNRKMSEHCAFDKKNLLKFWPKLPIILIYNQMFATL